MGNKAIVIGWINKGKPADCGETMKNQLMIQKLQRLGVKCYLADFKNWRKHPWVFLQLLWYMLVHRDATLIFSTSTINVYPMMKLMYRLKWRQHSVHWVIGGSLGENVKKGRFLKNVIDYMNWTIVESPLMKQQLEESGVHGVILLPNFKPINYYPDIKKRIASSRQRPLRFVFLSRIMPEKGCDYILESAQWLNANGFKDSYTIDFYGKIAPEYNTTFKSQLANLENVYYKGFLYLREESGYDKLSQYDLMLFPTYWKGEGFAGVFIDAFIAGLPMIASDWAHNRYILKEGDTALFIPVHDVSALTLKMKQCIERLYPLNEMAIKCQEEAKKYDVNNVITKELLKKVGII